MIAPSYLLLDKAEGVTSFWALGAIKRLAGTKKVGHTGTLDAFASGLLVVLLGHATKISGAVTDLDKRYEAEFTFGTSTDTLDPTGEITGKGAVPEVTEIESRLADFTGTIMQRPPAFSAVHIGGRRASELARMGETPRPEPREVRVDRFELRGVEGDRFTFDIDCSKGTYVRSLARDLAAACGSVAHVTRLRRIRVGPLDVADAVPAARFEARADSGQNGGDLSQPPAGAANIRPATELIRRLWGDIFVHLNNKDTAAVQNGVPARFFVAGPLDEDARIALVDPAESLVAMVRGSKSGKPEYLFVVPGAAVRRDKAPDTDGTGGF